MPRDLIESVRFDVEQLDRQWSRLRLRPALRDDPDVKRVDVAFSR